MTNETTTTAAIAITTEIMVPLERIVNAIIGAFEGGSTDWLGTATYLDAEGLPCAGPTQYSAPAYAEERYWNDGHRMSLSYDNPDSGEDVVSKVIGLPELTTGLSIMAAKHARHFADLIAENDDAITHDVFIQCVLMGDVIYG